MKHLLLVALLALPGLAMAEGFAPIAKRQEFVNLISGKALTRFGITLNVSPGGAINGSAFGNAASIYTSSGGAAREFRYRAQAGNIGVNLGIAAPMAYFPFCGQKASFFGSLHGQARDCLDFFTDRKVVISRWL